MEMKPKYVILITLGIGLAGGYLSAPSLLPAVIKAIYGDKVVQKAPQKTPETKPNADTPVADTTVSETAPDTEPAQSGEDFDWSEDPDDGMDRFADAYDPDAFEDGEEDETGEAEDPNGENITPKKIATYRRRGTAQGQGEDDGMRPVNEPHFTGKISPAVWKQPKILKRRLAGRLRSRLKGTSQEKVEAFLQDPEVRLMLAQWELLNRCDLDTLSKLMRPKNA